ncbi:hypothetical protein [Actinomadura formosensis]|uniref:hypothetical protein n=1 Tax=Actinomadura formosensis TaxID=60706 RepID=UPI003D9211C8
MRTWFNRVWGLRVGWLDIDPVAHLGDADETPAPPAASAPMMSGDHESDPDGPPIETAEDEPAVIERLDVPPERRPWDTARPTIPPTGASEPPHQPHCSGRHAIEEGLARCEWCEVLTDVITLVRRLEREVAELRAEGSES